MRNPIRVFGIASLFVLTYVLQATAQDGKIEEIFRDIKEIRIKTVSGDCIVEKGSRDEVRVQLTYTFDDYDYQPELEQRGDRLVLTERFVGRGSVRGHSTWRLAVPEGTDIDFSTASGNIEISELRSSITAETASGDVTLRNIEGEFKVSTASGDVEAADLHGELKIGTASGNVVISKSSGRVDIGTASGRVRANNLEGQLEMSTASGDIDVLEASGEFALAAASGDIRAQGIVIKARSEFSAASGDVELQLNESADHDLKISCASGDATLNFRGNPIRGFIEMTARAQRGRIQAPFEFDHEEYHYKWNDEYVTKTVTKGSDLPRITINTASGKATLLAR